MWNSMREINKEEKEMAMKLQSTKVVEELLDFFRENNVQIEQVVKQNLDEKISKVYSAFLWIYTSIGRFDLPLRGGMGITDDKLCRKFCDHQLKVFKQNGIIKEFVK